MEPSLPSMVAGVVLALSAIGFGLYAINRNARRETQLLDTLCVALRLQRDKIRTVPWALDTHEAARGERNGVPVWVQLDMTVGEQEEPSTTVTLEAKTPMSSGVTLDRFVPEFCKPQSALGCRFEALAEGYTELFRSQIDPNASSTSALRPIDSPWFGRCHAYGSDQELARVFNPAVRARLDQLPRRVAVVSLHDRILKIRWVGLEQDPAVVELALQIGADCLAMLAPPR